MGITGMAGEKSTAQAVWVRRCKKHKVTMGNFLNTQSYLGYVSGVSHRNYPKKLKSFRIFVTTKITENKFNKTIAQRMSLLYFLSLRE